MTLKELSVSYAQESELLRARIVQLAALSIAPEERLQHERRMRQLEDMQRQCREMAHVTARYYERGYCKSGKYAL